MNEDLLITITIGIVSVLLIGLFIWLYKTRIPKELIIMLCCVLALISIFTIRIPNENNAKDLACKKIGFDKSLGTSKCVNEEGYIEVLFDCEGFYKPNCIVMKKINDINDEGGEHD